MTDNTDLAHATDQINASRTGASTAAAIVSTRSPRWAAA